MSSPTTQTGEQQQIPPHFPLLSLPPELHLQISTYLSYPDALALKHSCRRFQKLVYTGVHLKVDWLVERFERKLECPMEKCSFRTDEAFCNWRIRRIIERRRRHLECVGKPGGCLVVEGRTCWVGDEGKGSVEALKGMVREVLIQASVVLFLQFLWIVCQRYIFGIDLDGTHLDRELEA